MIIPLGLGSLRDSSSLPEGRSNLLLRAHCIRAGPALPSYLALLHAGFSVPRMLPSGRWALTPPFHPCQALRNCRWQFLRASALDRNRQASGFSASLPPRCKLTGGLIFCGTFRSHAAVANLRPPWCAAPWRYQARCPAVALSCELATAG